MKTQTLLIAAAAAFVGYKLLSSKSRTGTNGTNGGGVADPPILGGSGGPGDPLVAELIPVVNRILLWTEGNQAAVYAAAQSIYDQLPEDKKTLTPSNMVDMATAIGQQVWPKYYWPQNQGDYAEVPTPGGAAFDKTQAWLLKNPANVRRLLAENWSRIMGVAAAVYGYEPP